MTILQQPDALSLSLNIKDFRIASTVAVGFVLKVGSTELVAQTYEPGQDGYVTIKVRDIVHAQLSYTLQQVSNIYQQQHIVATFTAVIDTTEVSFVAIRGGVDNLADTATNFLTANFLTWQPTVKPVTYSSPEFLSYFAVLACTAKLKAYFTDTNGEVISDQTITLASLSPGIAYTIPLQYAIVSALLGNTLPAYYDVWVEDATAARLTYIQRYYASNMRSEQEEWVLFENSLGGLDTFRAYGSTEFTGEHTHNLAEIDEVSEEYRVDTERKFQKNTGHLDKKERRWLLDFFPSLGKYIYIGSYLRKLVLTESDVTYTDKELPSNYTFTYKYADARPLLNLSRTDAPAEVLNIVIPQLGNFTVPPRLVELDRLPLTEGALFPVQSPYDEEWKATTAGAMYDFIANRLGTSYTGGGGVGHTHNNIDLLQLISYVEEYLLVNGLKIKAGYADDVPNRLRKDVEDTAAEVITFMKGLVSKGDITIGDFISGISGSGAKITKEGHAEMRSLTLWEFLEVPELRYNRVSINVGHQWHTNGGGIIESVVINPDGISGTVTLKLEDGEIGAVAEDDLCMGIWHDTVLANNEISTADDGIGNYRFAGFGTAYFRITSITNTGDNSEFTYTMRPLSANHTKMIHPTSGMHFAQFGNPSNTARQSARYSTTTYERYLIGVTTWEYAAANVAMQFGDCSNLSVFGLNMSGKSAYLNNIYMSGTIEQLVQLPAKMNIDTDGDGFLAWGEEMNITCTVTKGFDDITFSMIVWSVTRDSGDAVNDNAWNLEHLDFFGNIVLAFKEGQNDLGTETSSNISTMFTFTASDQAGVTVEQNLII